MHLLCAHAGRGGRSLPHVPAWRKVLHGRRSGDRRASGALDPEQAAGLCSGTGPVGMEGHWAGRQQCELGARVCPAPVGSEVARGDLQHAEGICAASAQRGLGRGGLGVPCWVGLSPGSCPLRTACAHHSQTLSHLHSPKHCLLAHVVPSTIPGQMGTPHLPGALQHPHLWAALGLEGLRGHHLNLSPARTLGQWLAGTVRSTPVGIPRWQPNA